MTRKPVSTRSSGNPFADLGMADADVRLAKAKLAQKITAVMRERAHTQAQIAEKLGVDQPRVSRLVRGQLKDFSIDKLMAFVNRLNMDIEINVMPNPEPARRAHTVVCYPEDRMAAAGDAGGTERVRFD
jgi:predicted XRE-type DNA-binding protein